MTVTLPDGSRALMAASETDVFGPPVVAVVGGMVLSVVGVRRLRSLLAGADEVAGRVRRRPWKVVRHVPGADVFVAFEEVCSTHASEEMAVRARARAQARAVRGGCEAKRWAWSVVCDHGGLLGPSGAGVK